ncbi:MAG TPA: thioesterase family protein, partial [Bryobacteraceae bacterium]|nr:thioesterase family protein [Bryobacteraceae bacterium]
MDTLQEFPVIITVPVHWGDQDSFGHVNNVMYLRWAETARVDYLIRVGIWQRYEMERIGPIVANITCDYRRALEYPETVRVGARITGVGTSSIRMAHRIVSLT